MVNHIKALSSACVYNSVKQELIELYPNADEESILDTLEGMTDVSEICAVIQRERLDVLAMVEAVKSRIATMQTRKERLEQKASKLKALILRVMQQTGHKRIVAPDFTISRRAIADTVIINDEAAIPARFKTIEQIEKTDKKALLSALKEGQLISGARLEEGRETISTKET